jgi:hypothetical protein
MSKAFPTSHIATERHYGAGIADYSRRMTLHQETADKLQVQATANTDEPGVTHWESHQALRMWAHEQELAQECMRAMFDCGAIRTRALMRQYAHNCYCKVRGSVARVPALIALTLAQVADSFTALSLSHSSAPPGVKTAPNVLATCHASNAPGLSPIAMTYWQVTRLE